MTPEQVIAGIRTIRGANPGNLMARHFDEDYFRSLDDQSRQRLEKVIRTGIENPDSQMGAYAMNPEDYDLFAPMLDPMIRDFHGIPAKTTIAQKHDWDTSITSCDLAAIDSRLKDISMRKFLPSLILYLCHLSSPLSLFTLNFIVCAFY